MNMSTTVNKDTNKEGLASSANKSMSLFTLMKNKISKNRIE